jgi:hypothetical protein
MCNGAVNFCRQLNCRAQRGKLGHQLREDRLKSRPRALERGLDRSRFAVGADDEVDRAMLEVPASRVQAAAGGAAWMRDAVSFGA